MSDTFNNYGHEFQSKAIAAIFSDKHFLGQIIDVVSPDYFEGDAKQWIVKQIVSYYTEYKDIPTAEVLSVKIGNLDNKQSQKECKLEMLSVWKFMDSSDIEFIKKTIVEFCKNQEIKKAILQSVDLLKTAQYDQIKMKIDSAMNVGIDTRIGHVYKEEVGERYKPDNRRPLETPWEYINALTKGGPGPGDLCVVWAPPGIGKSWILAAIGAHALKLGKTVLHYSLELSDVSVGRRYDCLLTGIPIDDLEQNQDKVEKIIKESVPGNLYIRRYFSRAVSTMGLRAHIEKCIRLDKKPDIIIVDYADLLRLTGTGELRHQIEHTYEDLRALGGEFECPVWSASQVNRANSTEDYIDADGAAEAFAKNNTPDFILSANKNGIVATGFIVKSRLGPSKLEIPGILDTDRGIIQFFDPNSDQARQQAQAAIMSEQQVRRNALEQYMNRNQLQSSVSIG